MYVNSKNEMRIVYDGELSFDSFCGPVVRSFVNISNNCFFIALSFFLLDQVMCWGLRNMKKYQLTSVTSPSIDFEIGDQKITSTVIKNLKRNPNFDQPLFFFDVVRLSWIETA